MKKLKNKNIDRIILFILLLNFHFIYAQLDILKKAKELNRTSKEIGRTVKEIQKISKNKTNDDIPKTKYPTGTTNTKKSNFLFYNDVLFYSKGSLNNSVISSSEYIEFTKMNILTADKNENEYLLNLISFFADNKRNNFSLQKCDVETIKYKVTQRETDGIPKLVYATFSYVGETDVRELGIQFDKGLPWSWFYNKEFMNDRGDYEGVIGHLNFTKEQSIRNTTLSNEASQKMREYRAKILNPRINDSLTNDIQKKFPGKDCSACLTRTVVPEQITKKYDLLDDYGYKVGTKEETETIYHITIKNKCNKNIKVVGISQVGNAGNKKYGVVWRSFKANYSYTWIREQNDLEGGFISAALLGGGEMNDIDLSCINKKFDTENGPEIQYLKIVEGN